MLVVREKKISMENMMIALNDIISFFIYIRMLGEQKIRSKEEQINELILNRGFVKIKVTFMTT